MGRGAEIGISIFISEFEERGVRKITTGITGLWQPSVHSNSLFDPWLVKFQPRYVRAKYKKYRQQGLPIWCWVEPEKYELRTF